MLLAIVHAITAVIMLNSDSNMRVFIFIDVICVIAFVLEQVHYYTYIAVNTYITYILRRWVGRYLFTYVYMNFLYNC